MLKTYSIYKMLTTFMSPKIHKNTTNFKKTLLYGYLVFFIDLISVFGYLTQK